MATLPINEMVEVNVTRQTQIVSLEDFGLLCVFTEDSTLAQGSVEEYTSYADFNATFTTDTSSINIYVKTFFDQVPSPTKIAIARVDIAGGDTYGQVIVDTKQVLDFYGVGLDSLELSDVDMTLVASQVQGLSLLWVQQVDNTRAAALATAFIASDYHRTALVSKDDDTVDTNRVDAAILGNSITKTPGSFNWANQQLKTVNASALASPAILALLNAGVNVYASVEGNDVVRRGVSCGENWYIDQVQAMDWLKIEMESVILTRLIEDDKVAMTDAGVKKLIGDCWTVVREGESLNILDGVDKDYAPTITAPSVTTLTQDQKNSRIGPTITVTVRLAGAINKVVIDVPTGI